MIASSSQRPLRMAVSSIDWFFLFDYLKLAVALFLLILMMCVSYEDVTWLLAIGKTRSALAANAELPIHLATYTETGEEWRLWQQALTVAAPIANLLTTVESSPAAQIFALFAPQLKESMDGVSQVSQRFAKIESGLRGLGQSSAMTVAVAQFIRVPTSDTLSLLASTCQDHSTYLQTIDAELQWMTPLAEQVNSGFAVSVNFLEDKQHYVPLPGVSQSYIDSLTDSLRQGSLAIRARTEALKHYQQIIQQDIQMMNVIINATTSAQQTTAFFGNGAWRRLMNAVRANAVLLLCANVALFVAEICLFIEQKTKVRL